MSITKQDQELMDQVGLKGEPWELRFIKNIYGIKKLNKGQIEKILNIEVENISRQHPAYKFKKYEQLNTKDGVVVIELIFSKF